jgi:hypothetical protein
MSQRPLEGRLRKMQALVFSLGLCRNAHDKTYRKCTLPLDFKEFGKNKKDVYEKKKIKILLTFPNWRGKGYMENKSRVHNYAKKDTKLQF